MPANNKPPRELLPAFADVAPRWADLTVKMLYLQRQEEELLAELEAMPPIVVHASPPKLKAPPEPESHRKPLSPAAKAALGDLDIPDPPAAEWRAPDFATESALAFPDPAMQEAVDIHVRLNGVREAIAAIHAALPRALAEGSRAYCDLVRDQYSERASRVCKALIELAAAYLDHEDFLSRVQAQGITTAFLAPLNLESTALPSAMGDIRAGGSDVFTILARAAEGGHFAGHAETVAALRKPAPPLPPAPFAEAVDAVRAAEQARTDARAGRATVIRWSPDNRSQRMMRRSEATKLAAAAQAPRVPEEVARKGLAARVRARLSREGERWADTEESTDGHQAA